MDLLKIKDKVLEVPIIQGGMGIGVSLGNLAGSVMRQGAMGTISAANPGFKKASFQKKPLLSNLEALGEEIKKARTLAKGQGMLAVNIMVKGTNYAAYVKQAVANKVDAIISGAGLPLELPKFVKGSQVAIAPIVSSGKAAQVICRSWERKHDRYPDFIVIEGADAGGHLGFTKEELESGDHQNLAEILHDVTEVVKPYIEKAKRAIPIFVAGGIYTGEDIAKYVKLGAAGVQMGTRFIGTHECDADDQFKQRFLDAKKDDVILTKSPAGLPGRALKTSLTTTLEQVERVPINWCIDCLEPCIPKTTVYCISEALMNAAEGKLDEHALVFTGINGHRINELVSVKELVHELMHEYALNMGGLIHA
ncbi:MAG: nitronate monooxygenase [Defluviitaleaceae bacterium]|nr:nitronate monooxygenase [Defluviitaleaceae bacterium]